MFGLKTERTHTRRTRDIILVHQNKDSLLT